MIGMTLIRGIGWPICPTASFPSRDSQRDEFFGRDGFFGAGSEGFVVALNASAACHGSLVRRVLSTVIWVPIHTALILPILPGSIFNYTSG
jgi:hypothetical protein